MTGSNKAWAGALIVVVLILVALGISATSSLLASSPPTAPQAVIWVLAQGGPGEIVVMPADHWRLDPTTSQQATVIPVGVYWPSRLDPSDDSWLATPEIAYTADSVTITLRQADGFNPCDPGRATCIVSNTTEPVYYEVQLSEPLRGRALFDGSADPARAWPY